jgi:DNA-binding transcriptional LysR family regulator
MLYYCIMDRGLLTHLPVVATVARERSFAAAAARLGLSPSATSHAVRMVEERLGEPVFARTTRSVALTEAGQRFLDRVMPALDDIAQAAEALRAARGNVTGLLRINASRVSLPMAITPILADLAARHPRLVVEVHSEDAQVDIVAQGFDAGVRLGEAIAQDMVAARLTPPFHAITVAAPAYLAARGEPRSLAELQEHNCIGFRLVASGAVYEWDLREAAQDVAVAVQGTVRVTDASYARELALAGIGMAYIFEPLVRADIAAGRLRRILPEAAMEEDGLFLYYPRRAARAPKLRAFLEAAHRCLAAQTRSAAPA